MGTKSLNENGPNPFFWGGGTKNMVRVNLMATVLFLHGFDNYFSLRLSMRGRCNLNMKLPNGNDHLFFKTR